MDHTFPATEPWRTIASARQTGCAPPPCFAWSPSPFRGGSATSALHPKADKQKPAGAKGTSGPHILRTPPLFGARRDAVHQRVQFARFPHLHHNIAAADEFDLKSTSLHSN